jgi:hypothetical protein
MLGPSIIQQAYLYNNKFPAKPFNDKPLVCFKWFNGLAKQFPHLGCQKLFLKPSSSKTYLGNTFA